MIDFRGRCLFLKRSHLRLPLLHSTAERPSFFLSFSHLLTMAELQQLHLRIKVQEKESPKHATAITKQPHTRLRHWQWWLMVALNITFILSGQTVGTLLGRFYYDQGGNSKWMATLVQSAGFPILLIPLFFYRFHNSYSTTTTTIAAATAPPSFSTLAFIYVSLGLLMAGDNVMYSYGLFYLPVSTYSLICATQLAFNAVFSYFFNSQKFTSLIFNSIVILTFSASLLAVRSDSEGPNGMSAANHAIGFLCTLGASAGFALWLSLTQLSFQKVFNKTTFDVVLEMQFYMSVVASFASLVGLFASGDWRQLERKMVGFDKGRVAYVITLFWTAVAWQVCNAGMVGLVFQVSSLFTNVIGTVGLPIVPILAVVFFHDKMDGVKVVSMLMAVWGFLSYIYQHYLDDCKSKKTTTADVSEVSDGELLLERNLH
ncbi:probable purine permease 11 isoform X2 [Magnolia sinica]|uniref:probable purine permease 11 isoform X2 n=1 Tax=Magnolia sinica TaxID=86752 RepID=UPI002658522D|nr:probable purine permease 11 isoform X2 [Magnolia sinica]